MSYASNQQQLKFTINQNTIFERQEDSRIPNPPHIPNNANVSLPPFNVNNYHNFHFAFISGAPSQALLATTSSAESSAQNSIRRAEETYAPGSLERNSNAAVQSKGRGKKKPTKVALDQTRSNNF